MGLQWRAEEIDVSFHLAEDDCLSDGWDKTMSWGTPVASTAINPTRNLKTFLKPGQK